MKPSHLYPDMTLTENLDKLKYAEGMLQHFDSEDWRNDNDGPESKDVPKVREGLRAYISTLTENKLALLERNNDLIDANYIVQETRKFLQERIMILEHYAKNDVPRRIASVESQEEILASVEKIVGKVSKEVIEASCEGIIT